VDQVQFYHTADLINTVMDNETVFHFGGLVVDDTSETPPVDTSLAESRLRCWTYTLDGHTFYVLDLGVEGTWVWDLTSSEWANFFTTGFLQWDVANGTQWGNRVVGGSLNTTDVWELKAEASSDNDAALDIVHTVTGGLQMRTRGKLSVGALRVMTSSNKIGAIAGTSSLDMRFSDDNGDTWSATYSVALTSSVTAEIAYRSLGSFAAPGRIFELRDVGGPVRIDGADVEIPGLDNGNPAG
jgi:hypothetical protein